MTRGGWISCGQLTGGPRERLGTEESSADSAKVYFSIHATHPSMKLDFDPQVDSTVQTLRDNILGIPFVAHSKRSSLRHLITKGVVIQGRATRNHPRMA
jgi:hypothetical protein